MGVGWKPSIRGVWAMSTDFVYTPHGQALMMEDELIVVHPSTSSHREGVLHTGVLSGRGAHIPL
jgi:hypothetical protein